MYVPEGRTLPGISTSLLNVNTVSLFHSSAEAVRGTVTPMHDAATIAKTLLPTLMTVSVSDLTLESSVLVEEDRIRRSVIPRRRGQP
jgi:hypothetical protein